MRKAFPLCVTFYVSLESLSTLLSNHIDHIQKAFPLCETFYVSIDDLSVLSSNHIDHMQKASPLYALDDG